jgi:hypothetical protein
MPYGNYWIVEAAYRHLHPDWSVLALGPTAPLTMDGASGQTDGATVS